MSWLSNWRAYNKPFEVTMTLHDGVPAGASNRLGEPLTFTLRGVDDVARGPFEFRVPAGPYPDLFVQVAVGGGASWHRWPGGAALPEGAADGPRWTIEVGAEITGGLAPHLWPTWGLPEAVSTKDGNNATVAR